MSELMVITPPVGTPPVGGRALLSRLHQDCLRDIFGSGLIVHEIEPAPVRGLRSVARALSGQIDGATVENEAALIERIRHEKVPRIFLNGSNLGRIARAVKRAFPEVEVLTFFHNAEARFFAGALKQQPSVRSAAVLAANYVAERLAVRFSDRLIALSRRDSDVLRRLYGRHATDILPMAVEDKLREAPPEPARPGPGDYLLFVGGAFYANLAGAEWFLREVSPRIAMRTVVVGNGMERLGSGLSDAANASVVGAVDDLEPWYRGARLVVAPIFDGSGMKTKTAEALMFGKKVAGTPEAFSGYEDVLPEAGWCCNSADEFVALLSAPEAQRLPLFDTRLRELYVERYSEAAATRNLRAILAQRPTSRKQRT